MNGISPSQWLDGGRQNMFNAGVSDRLSGLAMILATSGYWTFSDVHVLNASNPQRNRTLQLIQQSSDNGVRHCFYFGMLSIEFNSYDSSWLSCTSGQQDYFRSFTDITLYIKNALLRTHHLTIAMFVRGGGLNVWGLCDCISSPHRHFRDGWGSRVRLRPTHLREKTLFKFYTTGGNEMAALSPAFLCAKLETRLGEYSVGRTEWITWIRTRQDL